MYPILSNRLSSLDWDSGRYFFKFKLPWIIKGIIYLIKAFGREGEEILFRIKKLHLMDLFPEIKHSNFTKWCELKSNVRSKWGDSLRTDYPMDMFYFTTCPLPWKVVINLGEMNYKIENIPLSFKSGDRGHGKEEGWPLLWRFLPFILKEEPMFPFLLWLVLLLGLILGLSSALLYVMLV